MASHDTAAASTKPATQPSVEMDNLAVAGLTGATPSLDPAPPQEQDATTGAQQPVDGLPESTVAGASAAATQPAQETSPELKQTTTATSTTQREPLTRKETEALGPATEGPIAPPTGPALSITLMLTTGARHPYRIDEKYLRNRKVEASTLQSEEGEFDPRELSGYKLKELIWTDWRSEWEPRPASPSSIRLIILGRLIEDKAVLKGMWKAHSTMLSSR